MSEWGSDPDSRRALQRLIFRCASDYMLDEAGVLAARHEGDFVRAITWLAMLQVGDGEQRPISVRALSRSLNLPFETTRRKVRELEASGHCQLASGHRPMAMRLDPEAARADAARCIEGYQRLMAAMETLGMGPEVFLAGPPPPPAADQAAAQMAAHRLIQGFLLRTLEAGTHPHGSMVNALIFVGLMSANAAAITNDPLLARRYAGADTPPPDSLRPPARPRQIAERLCLPYEIVRRRLLHFVERGWVEKVGGGYRCRVERMQEPALLAAGLAICQRFAQLVQAVAGVGLAMPARARAA
ncbi:MAG TPA: hypothetical protein VEA44_12295 [Caulobacter sp.]|nr:hypothetical protein [Caulobacter sp.]